MHIHRSEREVGQQPNGEPARIPYIFLDGGEGPRVYIQANLHGAEIQGNAVIERFLALCKANPPKGRITLIPMANPIGINQKSGEFTLGRFDPISGENWNRQYHFDGSGIEAFADEYLGVEEDSLRDAFRQHLRDQLKTRFASPWGLKTGQQLALSLQRMALEADVVLDLHTGPKSGRHLYLPGYARERARRFNIPMNIVMPSDFGGALDEASFCPWWQLSEAFDRRGRELPVFVDAFTLELGPQEFLDPVQAQVDAQGIARYLETQGCWPEGTHDIEPVTQYACQLEHYRALYSPCCGQIEYLAPFETLLPAGAPVARIWHYDRLGTEAPLFDEITLDEDAVPVLHFASANVQQGTELYKFLTKVEPL